MIWDVDGRTVWYYSLVWCSCEVVWCGANAWWDRVVSCHVVVGGLVCGTMQGIWCTAVVGSVVPSIDGMVMLFYVNLLSHAAVVLLVPCCGGVICGSDRAFRNACLCLCRWFECLPGFCFFPFLRQIKKIVPTFCWFVYLSYISFWPLLTWVLRCSMAKWAMPPCLWLYGGNQCE